MAKQEETASVSIEQKLQALYKLQLTDSKIDQIIYLQGELPLEVKDLEDELAGLETRITKIETEIKAKEEEITTKHQEIKDAETQIKKYSDQQMEVRNNREFESLAKEIEYQNLEIELCQKRIKEFTAEVDSKKKLIESSKATYDDRKKDLDLKTSELDSIISETQKEVDDLKNASKSIENLVEDRLVTAYKRIRSNARNGLAVVSVERDACGGCFNQIPPQRQLDVKTHKKIIVCEYCGRILIDKELIGVSEE